MLLSSLYIKKYNPRVRSYNPTKASIITIKNSNATLL